MRILVATDGSDASLAAAHEAARLLPDADEVQLMTVVTIVDEPWADAGGIEGPLGTPEEFDQVRDSANVQAMGRLAATARAFGPRPVVEQIVEREDAATAIVDHAAEIEADVLVIGSHGHGVLHRALLGSVTAQVVQHAPCPVLVVPTDEQRSKARDHRDGVRGSRD
jgi:nucleotide-binding universal stress UspA family protein